MKWIAGIVGLCTVAATVGCRDTTVLVMNCSKGPVDITLRTTGFEMTSKLEIGETGRKAFRASREEGFRVDVKDSQGLHVQSAFGYAIPGMYTNQEAVILPDLQVREMWRLDRGCDAAINALRVVPLRPKSDERQESLRIRSRTPPESR
jgi:hypothetical protein